MPCKYKTTVNITTTLIPHTYVERPSYSLLPLTFYPSFPQLNPQWPLLPQPKNLLLFDPATRPCYIKLEFEIENYLRKNKSHLCIGKVTANAVPRSNTEGCACSTVVISKFRGWRGEPTFRDEGVR